MNSSWNIWTPLNTKTRCIWRSSPRWRKRQDEDSEDYGLIILRCVPGQNGEEDTLESVDDENILNAVYDQFMETLFDDEENEDE